MAQPVFPSLTLKEINPEVSMQKKRGFPLRISSVNVTILRKLRIWSHLLKKSLMENFTFCAVYSREMTNEISLSEKQFHNAFGAKEPIRIFPCFESK